jgi:hypothetical protein
MSTLGTVAAKYFTEKASDSVKGSVMGKVASRGMELAGIKKLTSGRSAAKKPRQKKAARRERDSSENPFSDVIQKSTTSTNKNFSGFERMGLGLFRSFIEWSKKIITNIQQVALRAFKKADQINSVVSAKAEKAPTERLQLPGIMGGENAETKREKSLIEDEFRSTLIEKLDEIVNLLKKMGVKGEGGSWLMDAIKGILGAALVARFAKFLKPLKALLSKVPVFGNLFNKLMKMIGFGDDAAKAASAAAKAGNVAANAVKTGAAVSDVAATTANAAKAADAVGDAAKGANVAADVAKGAKAADTAADVAKASTVAASTVQGAGVAADVAKGAKAADTATDVAKVGMKGAGRGLSRFLGPVSLLLDAGFGAYAIYSFIDLLKQRENKEIDDAQFEKEGKEHWVEIVRSLGYPAVGAIIGTLFGPGPGTLAGGVIGSTIGAFDWGAEWLTGWSPAKALGEYIFEKGYMGNPSTDKEKEIAEETQKNNEAIQQKEAAAAAKGIVKGSTVGTPANIPSPESLASSASSVTSSPVSSVPSISASGSSTVSGTITPLLPPTETEIQTASSQLYSPELTYFTGMENYVQPEQSQIVASARSQTQPPTIINNYYNNVSGGSVPTEDSTPLGQPSESVMAQMLSADAHGARMGINS